MLSVLNPLSVPAVISGVEGAEGDDVSIVITNSEDAGLLIPAEFFAVAVIL